MGTEVGQAPLTQRTVGAGESCVGSEGSKGSGDRKGNPRLEGIFRPLKVTCCRGSEPEDTDLRLKISSYSPLLFLS